VYCFGEVQAANAAPSSEHSNVASCSLAEKEMLASTLPVTAGGPRSIVVWGAVSSTTLQVWVAGVCSTIACGLWTWTRKVCSPSASPG
jgi:hypothetical protein